MFSFNGGSCLPPQLPPLPPPPLQFYNSAPSHNWFPYHPPPPLPSPPFGYPPPPPHSLPSPQTTASSQIAGLLPHPPYTETISSFAPRRGRGRGTRNGGRGGHGGHKWNVQKCESCDRVYKTEETFAEHLQSHIKCSQCDFSALPKKVKEHSQVHSLPDFLSFTSPDDIKRWREERKRNYPTTLNVAKKIRSEEQKRVRGQVANTPLYRYVNQLIGDYDSRCRGRGRGGRRGNYRGKWNHHNHSGSRRNEQSSVQLVQEAANPVTTAVVETATPTINDPPLNSDTATSSERIKSSSFRDLRGRGRGNQRRNNCGPKQNDCAKRKRKFDSQQNWMELPLLKKPTLLEKLLASTIRSEHNAILQCVRYTVQNNFFQPATPPAATLVPSTTGSDDHKDSSNGCTDNSNSTEEDGTEIESIEQPK